MRQLDVRQLQLQTGEEPLDTIYDSLDLLFGRLNRCCDRRFDGVPNGCRSVLNSVKNIRYRGLYGRENIS